jgi:hypothetical protein
MGYVAQEYVMLHNILDGKAGAGMQRPAKSKSVKPPVVGKEDQIVLAPTKPNTGIKTQVVVAPAQPNIGLKAKPRKQMEVRENPKPADELSFTGQWSTITNEGHKFTMRLKEIGGGHVTGQYSPNNGTIDGQLDESGRLVYRWSQEGGYTGTGVFELAKDGHAFSGTFSNSEDSTVINGSWSGTRD